jgi:cytochrome d ubiquinol oxidase subunit II
VSIADAVAAVMFVAVVLYSVFGGADFGSGVWDLTAGNARKGARMRRLIDHAIGPVWEANHVWLIFVLVFLWTGFPTAFVAIMQTLAIPFWLAGLGIVARGAGFAFRKFSPTLRWAQISGVVFATASLATPFFLGTIAGGIASGRVPSESSGDLWSSWVNPTSFLGGALALATCTYLAGVLLTADATKLGEHDLAAELRPKVLIGGVVTGAIALAGIPIVLIDATELADGLLTDGLPFALLSGVAGLVAMWRLWQRSYSAARISAGAAVAAVLAAWGIAQYPWLLMEEATIDDAAGADSTLAGLLIATGLAGVLVVPPLLYLLHLANSNRVGTLDPSE